MCGVAVMRPGTAEEPVISKASVFQVFGEVHHYVVKVFAASLGTLVKEIQGELVYHTTVREPLIVHEILSVLGFLFEHIFVRPVEILQGELPQFGFSSLQ